VERFGKLHSIEDSGWFLAIPFVDKIAYVIDIRERAMDIPPQSAITRDNVSVEVSGNLFVKFNDAERAAYGAFNPLYSVTQVGHFRLLVDPVVIVSWVGCGVHGCRDLHVMTLLFRILFVHVALPVCHEICYW
jgi:SPFH domain / Band 7 family